MSETKDAKLLRQVFLGVVSCPGSSRQATLSSVSEDALIRSTIFLQPVQIRPRNYELLFVIDHTNFLQISKAMLAGEKRGLTGVEFKGG